MLTAQEVGVHTRRMTWLGRIGLLVSIAHAYSTLALWGDGVVDKIVNFAMTLVIDLTIWALSEYIISIRMANLKTGLAVKGSLALAVSLAVSLNGGFMLRYMPETSLVNPTLAVWTSFALAVLVPAIIFSTGSARAEMSSHLHTLTHRTEDADALRRERDALVTQHDAERRTLDALVTQLRELLAQRDAEVETMRQALTQSETRIIELDALPRLMTQAVEDDTLRLGETVLSVRQLAKHLTEWGYPVSEATIRRRLSKTAIQEVSNE